MHNKVKGGGHLIWKMLRENTLVCIHKGLVVAITQTLDISSGMLLLEAKLDPKEPRKSVVTKFLIGQFGNPTFSDRNILVWVRKRPVIPWGNTNYYWSISGLRKVASRANAQLSHKELCALSSMLLLSGMFGSRNPALIPRFLRICEGLGAKSGEKLVTTFLRITAGR